jgi:cytidine deaminase
MPILLVPADYPKKGDDGEVVVGGGVLEETLGGLLPYSFGPEHLGIPRLPPTV